MGTSKRILAYHGTINEFTTFKTHPKEFTGYSGIGETILGAAFSESKEVAVTFPASVPIGAKRRIITAYLDIKNPAKYASMSTLRGAMIRFLGGEVTAHKWGAGQQNAIRFREHLEAKGHDGITYLEGLAHETNERKASVWIAFHIQQIELVSSELVEPNSPRLDLK